MTQEQLNEMLTDVINEALEEGIPVPSNIYPQVKINKRTKKRLGCCIREEGGFRIEISEFILECNSKHIKSVMAHEVLHSCEGCNNHGSLWKEYAAIMNTKYGYNIKRLVDLEELGIENRYAKTNIKYIMKCQSCGKEYPRQRYTCVMKKINAYRCTCGGKLTVIEL
ncbi:MAG: SprT-like domain-containing protein [Bacillota bacterium]|nr:SprT-like domain-containing protein [Bacillota bacterium]